MSKNPTVVIGNGWAALAAVGLLATQGKEVCWVTGAGAQLLAPLGSVESTPGVRIWESLASLLGIDCGDAQEGSFLREFRNKAFREPTWLKPASLEDRIEAKNASLWLPERQFAAFSQARFTLALPELESLIRQGLNSKRFPNLKRIEGVPVAALQFSEADGKPTFVSLASGDQIACEQVVYADRWSLLFQIEGIPKPMTLLRNREPLGVLQASFVHNQPIAAGVLESFFAPLPKEAGKEIERHIWGCFDSDGMKSVWTLCLSPEEVEDNHEIAKKLRKLKSTLDKIFEASGLIPPEKGKFGSTLVEEQVRFEEECIFSEGQPLAKPLHMDGLPQVSFMTDGYGPSWAFAQAGSLFQSPAESEPTTH